MSGTLQLRRRFFATSALVAAAVLATAGPALADNTIRIDISGANTGVRALSIIQDPVDNTNVISTTGLAGGAQTPIRGAWDAITINQQGGGNVLASSGITGTTGSTSASLSLIYGSASDGGNNSHTLSIGGLTAPANATVSVNVQNTDPANAANTITDTLNGSSLAYTLDVDGTDNTITNEVAATGAVSVSVTAQGGIDGSGNTISNTVTGATSANITVAVNSDGNSVTNTSTGSGAKVISVNLPVGGADGNTVSNAFGAIAGAQTSNLTVNGVTSRVNYGLTSGASGTVSNVTLNDVVGLAGAAGKIVVSQTGSNANLALTLNGGAFTMGSGLANSSGVVITQASNNATLSAVVSASANGYSYSISQ